MTQIDIPKHEYGTLRVFALSLSDDEAQALRDNEAGHSPAGVLGIDTIDTQHVEVFRVGDLGPMGLAGYLREGVDVVEADIARDAAKLAKIDGWVMLVYSSAFGGDAVTLTPAPELTLIGTYTQQQADNTQMPLESDAAAPYTGVPGVVMPPPPSGRANGTLFVAGLILLIAFVLWWVFS